MSQNGWKADDRSFSLVIVIVDLKTFAERSRYRPGSIALISISYLAVASALIGVPVLLVFVIGASALISLTVITYHRLRNANLSSAWLLLMILQFGIGPTWHLSEHVTFNIGGSIVGLVPVILGWFVPAKSTRKAKP